MSNPMLILTHQSQSAASPDDVCDILLRVHEELPSAWLPERRHTTDWHSGCSPKGILDTAKADPWLGAGAGRRGGT